MKCHINFMLLTGSHCNSEKKSSFSLKLFFCCNLNNWSDFAVCLEEIKSIRRDRNRDISQDKDARLDANK